MSRLYYSDPSKNAPPFEEFIEMLHPEDRGIIEHQRNHISSFTDPVVFESRTNPSIGPMRYLSNTFYVVRNTAGVPVQLGGTSLDVTERKRAEVAELEKERQFRTLANSIPQLCWMANADGWISWCNQRWYDFSGTTPEQLEGWGWQSVHDQEVLPMILDRWKDSIATGRSFEMTFPLRGADGAFRSFLTRVIPVLDADGKVEHWFGTNTDVTELKRMEEALHRSVEQLQFFVEHAPAALAMFDRAMRYLRVSRRWLADYDLGDRDLRGLSHYEVFPDVPEIWKDAHRRGQAGEVLRKESDCFERPDGALRWIRWEIRPWHEVSGSIGGIVLFTEDITERKRAEENTRRLSRVYTVLSDINQTIVREKDPQTMLESACRIAVEKASSGWHG